MYCSPASLSGVLIRIEAIENDTDPAYLEKFDCVCVHATVRLADFKAQQLTKV